MKLRRFLLSGVAVSSLIAAGLFLMSQGPRERGREADFKRISSDGVNEGGLGYPHPSGGLPPRTKNLKVVGGASQLVIPEELIFAFPQLRREELVVYVTNPGGLPKALKKIGRFVGGRHLLVPAAEGAKAAVELQASRNLLLPVFGEGDDRFFLTDRIIVRFDAADGVEAVLGRFGARFVEPLLGPENLFSAAFPAERIPQIPAIVMELSNRPDVLYCEPDWLGLIKPDTADAFFDEQWMLENTGQGLCDPVPGIVPDSDIDAESAWEYTRGDPEVWVAVLDDGVEWDHPDLSVNMTPPATWYDAVDDDQDPRPADGRYHGTCVAGIVAAVEGNDIGVAGVAPGIKVMPVRIADDWEGDFLMQSSWIVNGIGWASRNGAAVLNLSWSAGFASTSLVDALDAALISGRGGKGCVIVAAAGNDDGSIGDFPGNIPELITVGASSPADERKSPTSVDGEAWWGSNYGALLDCVAPGVKIYTTDLAGAPGANPGDYNCRFNGTSAAAPVAAAIAALVISAEPNLTADQVAAILYKSAERVGGYDYALRKEQGPWDNEMGYGRLNAHYAVAEALGLDYVPPWIQHSPLPSQSHTGPFLIEASIVDDSGVDAGGGSPRLHYRISGGAWITITDPDGPEEDSFVFEIPFIPYGSTVDYYLAAGDASAQGNTSTLPIGGGGASPPGASPPAKFFSFLVNPTVGVVTVNNDGPADYASIQAAVDASLYGDVIKVAGGTYRERLTLRGKQQLTILGGFSEDFSECSPKDFPSVIDGQSVATVASFFDCIDLSFDGFTLTGGNGSYRFGSAYWAGGFIVKGGSSVKLSRLTVTGCSAYVGGGGVLYQTENCTVRSCRIIENHASSSGSGLYVRECYPEISYSVLANNTSTGDIGSGSALSFHLGGGSVYNLTIVGNTKNADYGSAGVQSSSEGAVTLRNSIIRLNYRDQDESPESSNIFMVRIRNCLINQFGEVPSFFDAEAAGYHLREGSIGIDMGADLGETRDFDGRMVPWGDAPDMGAFEHRPDLDKDGLRDIDELDKHLTDPFNPDFDGDRMADGWEIANGLDPRISDAHGDFDGDGLNAFWEYAFAADPAVFNASPLWRPVQLTDGLGIQYFGIEYTRPQVETGINYVTEVSFDLSSWYAGPSFSVMDSTIDHGDGTRTVIERMVIPHEWIDQGFLRVRPLEE